jgi:glycosyltransferase involved in cell wall biosynthesis
MITGEVNMPLISLAMIVKNEEATLAHCLGSVKPLIDEIIIVDTGSTDKTIEIATSFGARVYPFQWCDDFSAARNESLKFCTGDWILILDGDEAIDALDYEKIKGACASPTADGYALVCRHYLAVSTNSIQDCEAVLNNSDYAEGKNIPFYADSSALRLVRRIDGLSYTGRIHETIGPSLLSLGGTITKFDAVIHHYGKLLNDREEYKLQYYLMLTQLEVDKDPENKWAQNNLLQQALAAQQWEAALSAAQASLALDHDVEPHVLYGGGLALQQLNRHEEAIKYFDMLLGQNPRYALAMLRKGSSYASLGNINMGRQLMKGAIEMEPSSVQSYGPLAELELDINNIDAARQIALEAIKIAPHEPSLYDLLLKIEIARNNYHQLLQDAILGIKNCPKGGNGMWHRLAVVYLCKAGERSAALSILKLGLEAFPNDPELPRLKGMI